MDEEIVFDEDYNNSEEGQEENILSGETSTEVVQQIQFDTESINFSEPFFMGVTISGVMCMLSLGVYVVLRIFRNW